MSFQKEKIIEKFCCEDCFNSHTLKEYIKNNSEKKGNCDYCGKKNNTIIAPRKLCDLFIPMIELYDPVDETLGFGFVPVVKPRMISEKIYEDWKPFTEKFPINKISNFLIDVFGKKDHETGRGVDVYTPMEDLFDYYGVDETHSEILESKWKEFCDELIFENRFFPKKESSVEILSDVKILTKAIKRDTFFYRARKSNNNGKIRPKNMGMPPKDVCQPGRGNPKGIPYLYLASDDKTAIYEIRPNIEDNVTVGVFKVERELSLINLSKPQILDPFSCHKDLRLIMNGLSFFRMLGHELTKPIDKNNKELEYLPTQYLCEFLKHEGYDGVLYKSNVGPGENIVLFKDSKIKCTRSKLYSLNFTIAHN